MNSTTTWFNPIWINYLHTHTWIIFLYLWEWWGLACQSFEWRWGWLSFIDGVHFLFSFFYGNATVNFLSCGFLVYSRLLIFLLVLGMISFLICTNVNISVVCFHQAPFRALILIFSLPSILYFSAFTLGY